jgi:hypothetical protein
MPVTMIACQGPAGRRLMEQVGGVLDPLARKHLGTDPRTLRPIISRRWREAFRAELPEPALSRCAAAISAGRPWQLALWSNDLLA